MDEYTKEQVLLWYERIENSVIDFILRVPYISENKKIQAPILASYWIDACALLDSVFRDMTPNEIKINRKNKKRSDCKIKDFAHLYSKSLDLSNTKSVILVSPPQYISPFEHWKGLASGGTYESLDWWHDYNNLKHDRIRCIEDVTLEGTINALCALHQILAKHTDMIGMLVRRGWFPKNGYVLDRLVETMKNSKPPGTFIVQTALFAVPVGQEQFPEYVEDIRSVIAGYVCTEEFNRFIGNI